MTDMVGNSSVEFSNKDGRFYSTFRTIENETKPDSTKQNQIERNKTFYRFCLVLVRTLKTFSWFCIVLASVLVGFVELSLSFWNGSGTLIVLLIVLNAIWLSPTVLYRKVYIHQVDTVALGIPYYCMGELVGYLETTR